MQKVETSVFLLRIGLRHLEDHSTLPRFLRRIACEGGARFAAEPLWWDFGLFWSVGYRLAVVSFGTHVWYTFLNFRKIAGLIRNR